MGESFTIISKQIDEVTKATISSAGTGTAIDVMGCRNFNVICKMQGTGTAQATLEASPDNGTSYYTVGTVVSRNLTGVTKSISAVHSDTAHSTIRARLSVFNDTPSSSNVASSTVWVIAN